MVVKLKCARCGDKRTLTNFAVHNNRPTRHNRQSYCRQCQSDYKEERASRRDGPNALKKVRKKKVEGRLRKERVARKEDKTYEILSLHSARIIYENKGFVICIVSDFRSLGRFDGDMKM